MYTKNNNEVIHQGDIFEDILLLNFNYDPTEKESLETEPITLEYDYLIVLSQECDLKGDLEERKLFSELNVPLEEYLSKIESINESTFSEFSAQCISLFDKLIELKRDKAPLNKFKFESGNFKFKEGVKLKKNIEKLNKILTKIKSYLHEDPYLPNILVAPIYLPENFKKGQQVKNQKMKNREGDIPDIKKNNKHKRFHYLEKCKTTKAPEGIIDFKHFFTVPRDVLYKALEKGSCVATLNTPYKESLSQRFAYYLSRIGLPERQ